MKRVGSVVALTLALSVLASAGTFTLTEGTPYPNLSPVFGTLVKFDDQPTGNPVNPSQYVGVDVSSIADVNNQLFYFPGTQSPPNYVGTGGNVGWAMDTFIKLVNPTNQIGLGLAGPGFVTLAAYGANGSALASYSFNFLDNDYWVIGDTASEIASLEIQSDFIAIDDLQFNATQSIPEPAVILVMFSGLAAMVFGLRRRSPATRSTQPPSHKSSISSAL